MIAALYQSRPTDSGGTRKFIYNGVSFGWHVIEDMYYREVDRRRTSQCSRIPNSNPIIFIEMLGLGLMLYPPKSCRCMCVCVFVSLCGNCIFIEM